STSQSDEGSEELLPALAPVHAVVTRSVPGMRGRVGEAPAEPRRHLGIEDVVGVADEELDVLGDIVGPEAPVEEAPHVVERTDAPLREGSVELSLEHRLEH